MISKSPKLKRVSDAAANVRFARKALARPAAHCFTKDSAEANMFAAMAELANALIACPDHTATLRLG